MNRPIQPDIHPDSDSLNAFAERALPEAERERILEHMAGCARCRDIVYLARQMAGADAAPASETEVQAEPQRRWWSPVFSHWRIAWIPAAALAAGAGVLVWVHVRPAQRAVDMARVAAPPALAANASAKAPAPGASAARSVEHAARRAEATPKANRQADQAVPGEMGEKNIPAPVAPPVQPRAAMSAPAQVAIEPPLANMHWQQPAETAPLTAGQTISAKSARAPASPGTLVLHGSVMAPPKAGPTALTADATSPEMQFGSMPQPVNGLAALQMTKHLKLPSGLTTVSSAAVLNRLLAVDSAGALYLSVDAGKHWDPVPVQWTGKAIEIRAQPRTLAVSDADADVAPATATPIAPAAPLPDARSTGAPFPAPGMEAQFETAPPAPAILFRLVNDRHRAWISTDGKTWREQPTSHH
jgi:hypothetical protein